MKIPNKSVLKVLIVLYIYIQLYYTHSMYEFEEIAKMSVKQLREGISTERRFVTKAHNLYNKLFFINIST